MQMDPGAGSPYGGPNYFSQLGQMHPGSHVGAYGPGSYDQLASQLGGYGSTGPGGMHSLPTMAGHGIGYTGTGMGIGYQPGYPGVPTAPGGVGHYGAYPQNPGQYPMRPFVEPGGFGTGGWGGVGSGGQGFMHPMHWNQLMDHLARGQHAFSGFGGGGVGSGPSNLRVAPGGWDGSSGAGGMGVGTGVSPGDLGLQSYPGSPHPQARPFQGWGGGPVNY